MAEPVIPSASPQRSEPGAELKIPDLHQGSRLRRVLAALALVAAAGGAYKYTQKEEAVVDAYRTVATTKRDVIQLVEASGRLDVTNRVDVPAPAPGQLLAIHVIAGQTIAAGQPLAELDARAAMLGLRGAEAAQEAASGGVTQARARVEAAQHGLERARALVARGLVSPEDVKQAESDLAQANAALDGARGEQKLASQNVASARLGQTLTRIVAPSAGVVLRAPERVGAAVSPDGGPLFVIGDALTTMRVEAQVSETEIGLVKAGQTARVLVSAYPGRSYTARVERIGIDAERRDGSVLYPMRLLVDNPDGSLLPGMTARVELEVARASGVLSVHEAALRFTPPGEEAATPRSRIFLRKGPAALEAVKVRALVTDGVYAQIEAASDTPLPEGALVAVGLQTGKGATTNVTLGGKK